MSTLRWEARKVVVVGAGAVGSTFAYALAQSGHADQIVLVDVNRELAQVQALDLVHGLPFFPAVEIRAGTPADYRDASVVVVTAGVTSWVTNRGTTRQAALEAPTETGVRTASLQARSP